jgi:4-amino-4-deoxy-L-arabinose transferase-like glycosyltransferase
MGLSMPRIYLPRWVLLVTAAGLVVRLFYLTEHAASPFFGGAVLDELYYDSVARAVLSGGDVSGVNPGFRPLLYPFFLAAVYGVGGEWGRELAILVQHLLGIGTALLVAALADRLFRDRLYREGSALAAGLLYVLAGPPLFFEGELLIATLAAFLTTLLLLLFARAAEEGRRRDWIAAGVCLALAAQARPNVLVLLGVFLLGAFMQKRAFPLLGVGAALLTLVLWGAVQAPLTGHFQLLGGSGGVNLYLGNKAGADGMVPRQDRATTYGVEYRDSVQIFADEVFRETRGRPPTSPGELSRFWTGRVLGEVRAAPGTWLALMARKLTFLTWNLEIPNNKSYAFAVRESALLGWMPIRWWLLFALAPWGAVVAWRARRRPAAAVTVATVLYALTIVAFFVNSRFRIPLWPVLAVLAAGGGVSLLEKGRRRTTGLAVAAVLAGVSLVNWWGVPAPGFERDFFFRSIAHYERGDAAAALADARASVELEDDDAAAWFQVGTCALALDEDDEAWTAFQRAADLQPGEPRVWHSLGVVHQRRGHPREAYRAYLRAVGLLETYAPAQVHAALLELRAGLVEQAEARLDRAAAEGYEALALLVARAAVAESRGRSGVAWLERARGVDPEGTDRLLAELRDRLVPGELTRRSHTP